MAIHIKNILKLE